MATTHNGAVKDSTPASLTSLPLDLLADILDYLPLCARFAVVSRVCQRLRQAVSASVRTVSEAEYVMLCRLIMRAPPLGPSLTNLHALHIATSGAEAALLRMPLHRVRSFVCRSPGPGAQVAARLSSLTSLEITSGGGFSFVDPNHCSLISRNASTLTSLAVHQAALGTRVSLPHLRSLTSEHAQVYATLPATSLSRLDRLARFTPPQSHMWPALRSLALNVCDDLADAAPFLFGLHSQLTCLALRNVDSGDAECRLIAQLTCLTEIHFRSEPQDLPRLRHALAHTKLRRVSPIAPLLPLADLFGPHLIKLNLQHRSGRVPPTDGTIATCVTNLRSLTIPDRNMHHLPAWRLPHLRKLTAVFTPNEDGFYAAIRNLTSALSQLPSLRRLTLRPTYAEEDFSKALNAFEEALALCRDRGVDVCVHVASVGNARTFVPSHPWVTVAVHTP